MFSGENYPSLLHDSRCVHPSVRSGDRDFLRNRLDDDLAPVQIHTKHRAPSLRHSQLVPERTQQRPHLRPQPAPVRMRIHSPHSLRKPRIGCWLRWSLQQKLGTCRRNVIDQLSLPPTTPEALNPSKFRVPTRIAGPTVIPPSARSPTPAAVATAGFCPRR